LRAVVTSHRSKPFSEASSCTVSALAGDTWCGRLPESDRRVVLTNGPDEVNSGKDIVARDMVADILFMWQIPPRL